MLDRVRAKEKRHRIVSFSRRSRFEVAASGVAPVST